MDQLGSVLGSALGYGSPAIILFCIAFVVAKSIKKTWPYTLATVLTVLFYVLLMVGWNYLEVTGQ